MEKFKENFVKTLKDKDLYIYIFITLMFFGIFCIMQNALDTYSVFSTGAREITKHFASCGRFVTAGSTALLLGLLKLGQVKIYYLSYALALICTILSLYKFNKIIKEDVKNRFISILISTLVIINPFSLELYIYIEKGIMILSILLCVLAFEQITKYFIDKNKKSIFKAIVLMFVANCCYQGTIGLFVVISLVYILKHSKDVKQFIKNNVIVALTYGIPTIINFLLIKLFFTNGRISGEIILSESIKKVTDGIIDVFQKSYGLLPEYVFSFSMIGIVVFILYKIIKQKCSSKEKTLKLLSVIYIIGISLLVTIAPQLCQSTESIWLVPRSSYPLASVIGVLILYLFVNFDIKNAMKNIIGVLFVIFLSIQFVTFTKHSINGYIVNYEDKQNMLQIIDYINDYENRTGIIVNKVALYNDKNPLYTYKGIETIKDMNLKAFSSDWALVALIKYYTNKDFELVEKDEQIELNFKQKDWNYFSNEQIIIKDDVVHICNF